MLVLRPYADLKGPRRALPSAPQWDALPRENVRIVCCGVRPRYPEDRGGGWMLGGFRPFQPRWARVWECAHWSRLSRA